MNTIIQAEAGLHRVSGETDRMQHQLIFAAMKSAPIMIRLLNSTEKDDCGF